MTGPKLNPGCLALEASYQPVFVRLTHCFLVVCVCVSVCVWSPSCDRPFATSWTVAWQAPLSMGFSRQKDWSGLPFPSPEALPDPGVVRSPALQADSAPSEPAGELGTDTCPVI